MHKNAFETGQRRVIPAVLVYLRDGDRVLMIHRVSQNSQDFHSGKWNGLGGKLEADESPLQAAQRETFEEAGVSFPESRFQALGVLQFPLFKVHKNEDWMVYVFSVTCEAADIQRIHKSCDEGELHWVQSAEVLSLNLWPGDRHFMPAVLASQPFIGTLWYEQGNVVRHWLQRL